MDFALFLFVLLIVTGVAWTVYYGFYRKRYPAVCDGQGNVKAPWWHEYCGSFFGVILIVFCVRSFLVEPFRIPSSSMVPTLLTGDFILANKFAYGVRLPVINKKIIEIGEPERGDIVVFQFPQDPSVNYIKRLIGKPGDVIVYRHKVLTINGRVMPKRYLGDYLNEERLSYSARHEEKIDGIAYQTLNDKDRFDGFVAPNAFPYRKNCHYDAEGFVCTVPPGQYFMMGDNRDNSADSRIWGFVADNLLVGKAFFIWFHMDELSRIGPIE